MTKKHFVRYELVFVGSINQRYRRWHSSYECAHALALRILPTLEDRAAHPAIIYGPEFSADGFTVP